MKYFPRFGKAIFCIKPRGRQARVTPQPCTILAFGKARYIIQQLRTDALFLHITYHRELAELPVGIFLKQRHHTNQHVIIKSTKVVTVLILLHFHIMQVLARVQYIPAQAPG